MMDDTFIAQINSACEHVKEVARQAKSNYNLYIDTLRECRALDHLFLTYKGDFGKFEIMDCMVLLIETLKDQVFSQDWKYSQMAFRFTKHLEKVEAIMALEPFAVGQSKN